VSLLGVGGRELAGRRAGRRRWLRVSFDVRKDGVMGRVRRGGGKGAV
jgi:hypothetical protein